MFKNSSNGYTSYMDGNLPFDINDFKRESPKKQSLYETSNTGSKYKFKKFFFLFLLVLDILILILCSTTNSSDQ